MRTFVAVAALVLSLASAGIDWNGGTQAEDRVPEFAVDVAWPKPFPNRWVIGGLGGLCVDARDHVLLLNRQDVLDGDLNAGRLAPPIIELDASGAVVHSWGDPTLLDARLHSCHFDAEGNAWIASAPSGMVQKYTHDGSRLLLQIGTKGVFDTDDGTAAGAPLNSDAARFYMPSAIHVDPTSGDVYVADGESRRGQHRIAVMDREGRFLRQWQPEGSETVHCMDVSVDGLVYVCNREAGRLQVYERSGAFVRNIEIPWMPYTPPPDGVAKPSGGAAVSIAFSRDAAQQFLFVINQNLSQIEIVDRRTGVIVGHFGGGVGHFPGQFDQPHGIAVDSRGYVYVAENRGKRVQRFIPVTTPRTESSR